jgi:hypothetical protein
MSYRAVNTLVYKTYQLTVYTPRPSRMDKKTMKLKRKEKYARKENDEDVILISYITYTAYLSLHSGQKSNNISKGSVYHPL